jgi:hypothetical protein
MPKKSKSTKSAKSVKSAKAKSLTKTFKSLSPIPGSPGGPGGMSFQDSVNAQKKTSISMFAIFIGLIALIINVYAIVWIYKLETIDCKCSNNWMRTYIKYYLHAIIPIMSITLLINIYLYFNDLTYRDITNDLFTTYRVIAGFVNFFGLVNIIISIIFINELKKINCECSEDIKREVYFIYNIIMASIISISILIALMSIPLIVRNR